MRREDVIYGFSPNYFDVTMAELNKISEQYDEDIDLSPIEQGYTRFHPGGALLSEGSRDKLQIDCKNRHDGLIVEYQANNQWFSEEISCVAAFTSLSGSFVSWLPRTNQKQELNVSVPDLIDLMS